MSGEVVSLDKKRQEKKMMRKREFERMLFDNFLGVFISVEHAGKWIPIEMVDISPRGCLLQVKDQLMAINFFKENPELNLRFYFTPKHYLPVNGRIKHSRNIQLPTGEHYIRCGVEFLSDTKSFRGLASFIDFIYNLAEHACIDQESVNS